MDPLASSRGLRGFAHLIDSLKQRDRGSVGGCAAQNSDCSLGAKGPLRSTMIEHAAPALATASPRPFVFPPNKNSAAFIRK